MSIKPLTHDELEEVSNWLARLNEQDEHFVAWLDSGAEAIKEQLTPLLSFDSTLAWVGRQSGEITGFIGILPFFNQNLCRLLGPFTTDENASFSMEELWIHAQRVIENYFDIVKVAFFKQNQALTSFCEKHGFYLYNKEKNLLIPKEKAPKDMVSPPHIVPYQEDFAVDIQRLHPNAAYYTPEELLHLTQQPHNHLWCYVEDQHVKGYVYFEEIMGTEEGEICFVNVEKGERSQGIGRTLIQYASQIAFQELDCSLVTLSVRTENAQAEKLYKELGFIDGPTIYAYEKRMRG